MALLEQTFVKDPDHTIGDLLRDASVEVGAEVSVTGFHRFKLGEVIDT